MTDDVTTDGTAPSVPDVDAVVIGAGFAGMYMVHRLLESDFTVQAFETGDGVGGTWYWNRYPGARCDVESVQYSYSFSDELQQEWDWTERYATQPEILRYAEYVADRFELRKHISFNTKVVAAHFEDENQRWSITTDTGQRVTARYCISAVGCLSDSRIPEWPGLDEFRGSIYHTGRWPHHAVDLSGQRVGVVGTGSSGIQLIPAIATECEQLYVFQRTPNYTIPARNRKLSEDELRAVKARYAELRAAARRTGGGNVLAAGTKSALEVSPTERTQEYERRWQLGGNGFVTSYTDIFLDIDANETAAEFVRERIRELVANPDIAEKLTPRNHPIGSKRICVDTEYYSTFNRENVHLVDVSEAPIQEITPTGLRTTASEYELDTLIFATGYDAITGPLLRMDIRGARGVKLADEWAAGPRTYLGLAVAGFPNLFVITGPGSPSVLANVIMCIEQHVDWITDLLVSLRDRGVSLIESDRASQDAWVEHVNELASHTVYPRANSWYLGSNVPGKTRVFMPYVGGLHNYRDKCDEIAAAGYPGFLMAAER